MRRPRLRLRRPGTWPRWFWYLLFVVWSFLTAVGVTLLSVALYDSEPLPTFAGALAISLIFEAAWLTWGEYQRRRPNS